jgi:hypothetical protein
MQSLRKPLIYLFHCLSLCRECALHLSLVLFNSFTLSRSHWHTHSLCLRLSLFVSLPYTHTHIHSGTHTLSLSLSLSLFLYLPPSPSHSLSSSLPPSPTPYSFPPLSVRLLFFLSQSLSRALSLSLSSRSRSLFLSGSLSPPHCLFTPLSLRSLSHTLTQRKTHTDGFAASAHDKMQYHCDCDLLAALLEYLHHTSVSSVEPPFRSRRMALKSSGRVSQSATYATPVGICIVSFHPPLSYQLENPPSFSLPPASFQHLCFPSPTLSPYSDRPTPLTMKNSGGQHFTNNLDW